MKRKRGAHSTAATPTKRARQSIVQDSDNDDIDLSGNELSATTPSKSSKRQKQSLSYVSTPTKSILNVTHSARATPKSLRKVLFETPSKQPTREQDEETPSLTLNADRSARRKSSRRLIEKTLVENDTDDSASEQDDILAREILDNDEEEEGSDEEEQPIDKEDGILPEPETPTKRRRGRPPKAQTRKRSPTPPQDLPPHEKYFWQNRPGANKTSDNKLPANALLNHDEYFQQMQSYEERHQDEREFLLLLHARSFDQWLFELEEGFSICLYGYGSKRELLQDFASHLHESLEVPPKVVIINGYIAGITIRDILTAVAEVFLPKHLQLPIQPPALLEVVLEALSSPALASVPIETPASSKKKNTGKRKSNAQTNDDHPPSPPQIFILLNSIDSPSLRHPRTQSLLASLSSHPRISLLCTADTITFPLLWDAPLRHSFRFLFHDCTTFAPYPAAELDVVEAVNQLLGRSGRRVGGRDGVAFVLKSLPANARSLFRVLVAEQVAAGGEQQTGGGAETEDGDAAFGVGGTAGDEGVEYRLLYRKAVEELICTNENGFRTLLKEFYDHQMVESRRDALGTERLVVPFRIDELEGLLEELVD